MPAPVLEGFAADLYDRLAPWADADAAGGYALAWLCAAVGDQFRDVDAAALDWTVMFNPDTAPEWALRWLAQFAGVQFEPTLTVAQQRDRIRSGNALLRGTLAAIRSAAALYLTGTKYVAVRERYLGDAYQLRVVTRASETPNAALVEQTIRAVKPAGLVLTYTAATGQTYNDLANDYATYDAVAAAFHDYDAVASALPD